MTHVVLLTPPGRAAVASLLVEGPEALQAVEAGFRPASRNKPLGTGQIRFGRWGAADGEEVVACRTADAQIEIHCHGGRVATQRIERDLVEHGCQPIAWTDSVLQRGEKEGRMIEAEAQIALAHARTERTAGILLDQWHGALERDLRRPELRQTLLDCASLGLHLTTPWKVVLAGRPNVGKSSLINAIVGYSRAIVFDQPGTTRDVITATTVIDGWPVELADTAGLRTATDELEAEGISRAKTQMAAADLVLLIFDASQPFTDEEAQLAAQWPAALIVLNKCDLPRTTSSAPASALFASAVTRQGIDELLSVISGRLVPHPPPPGSGVPFTQRQIEMLETGGERNE